MAIVRKRCLFDMIGRLKKQRVRFLYRYFKQLSFLRDCLGVDMLDSESCFSIECAAGRVAKLSRFKVYKISLVSLSEAAHLLIH